MLNEVVRLDNIKECLFCHTSVIDAPSNRDHYLPRALINRPARELMQTPHSPYRMIDLATHPFSATVWHSDNTFNFCYSCHNQIDNLKIPQLIANYPLDDSVDKLCSHLRRNYPLTGSIRYRRLQIEQLIRTNNRFITTAANLHTRESKQFILKKLQKSTDPAREIEPFLSSLPSFTHKILRRSHNLTEDVENYLVVFPKNLRRSYVRGAAHLLRYNQDLTKELKASLTYIRL